MKTQISRDSFRSLKRYSGVYQQQGRMLTDADWNELMEVVKRRLDEAVRDAIGSGAPRDRGLGVLANFQLRPGIVYVDGVSAQLPGDSVIDYQDQPDFSQAQTLPLSGVGAPTGYVLYADVWERAVIALEDDVLLDAGLHGADTCTRSRTMLQIKWCESGIDPSDVTINPSSGNAPLTLSLWRASSEVDPCDPCAAEVALDTRVGNYLFRVEVHQVLHHTDGSLHLTLKWSSENGAEQHRFEQLPPGFKQGDWVYEFFNLACEENLGVHLAKNFTPSRGQLSTTFPSVAPAGKPWVRRWDGSCELHRSAGGVWSLASGTDKGVALSTGLGSDAHGYASVGADLELNLAAMALSLGLSTHQFVPGDYWLAPVREASDTPGDTLLNDAAPQGVKHHYLVLAELDPAGVVQVSYDDADRRRMEFPPLSDLWAKDVGYDPAECDESPAQNVQEALDWLCQQRDLRFHNKHLHGWGIVCGLQVECGPDTAPDPETNEAARREVRIRKGYAIDCEGHDLVLDAAQVNDLMALVEAYDQTHPDNPILADGNGTISLIIERGPDGTSKLSVEKYDPKQETWAKMLDGTLLMDFYQDCIKGLVEALQEEIQGNPEEEKDALVGPTLRRWISLFNLIVQIFNHSNGQYVFLSPKEHTILKAFYLRLQELLRSKTFCAMFEGDDFPDYPFADTGLSTIFGKGWHTRLRLAPDGKQIYTCGAADNTIHVFDAEKEEMTAEVLMPAGEGAMVVDVAVDPSGKVLYAIAVLKTGDTVIGIADIDGQGVYSWRPVRVFCGLKFSRLILSDDGKTLWAIGLGAGLFALDPDTVLTGINRPDPKYQFNATGHLNLDQNTNQAWATASSGTEVTSTYNQVVGMAMGQAGSKLNPQKTISLVNPGSGAALTGEDDLLVVSARESNQVPYLCVVSNRFDANDQSKHILVYDADIHATTSPAKENLLVEDSTIRLGWHVPTHRLMVTVEDGYRLQLFSLANGESTTFRHPLQISPLSIASDSVSDRIYVLNFVSNTISIIPGSELVTSDEFISALAEYRDDALAAFWGLAGGLLQYLKDCFCHHLLVNCPECSEADKLYLAGVEVRGNKIYKICNFAKRKYVKSFPTVDYWLSLVPVMPLLKKGVEKLCCLVFPDLFDLWYGKMAVDNTSYTHLQTGPNKYASADLRKGVQMWQGANFKTLLNAEKKNFNLYPQMAKDSILNRIEAVSISKPGVDRNQLLEVQVDEAQTRLENQGVQVAGVKTYDRMQDVSKFTAYRQAPVALTPGAKVTLYESGGKVMFYTLAEEPGLVDSVSPEVKADIENLEQRKTALRDLSEVNAELAKVEARRAETMNLAASREELRQLEGQKSQVAQEINTLKAELTGLKEQRAELSDLSAMTSEISTARARVEALRKDSAAELAAIAELDARRGQLSSAIVTMGREVESLLAQQKEISLNIARDRPVRDISGVDSVMEKRLNELGVRTVNDLAKVDINYLRRSEIDEATATAMVLSAQSRLKVLGG